MTCYLLPAPPIDAYETFPRFSFLYSTGRVPRAISIKKSTDCIHFNISVDAYQDIISRPYPIIFSLRICRCCRLPGLRIYHITLFCCIYIYTSSRVILSSTLTAASGSLSPTILYALPFIRWTIVP